MSGKGIISPWSKEAQPEVPEPTRRREEAPSHEVTGAVPGVTDVIPVRFEGRNYVLMVRCVVPKRANPTPELARAQLGLMLFALFGRVKTARKYLQAQSIDTEPPLGPKVTLQLGSLTLYARASSMDEELALRMAVDRLAMALLECRGWNPDTKRVLDEYGVVAVKKMS